MAGQAANPQVPRDEAGVAWRLEARGAGRAAPLPPKGAALQRGAEGAGAPAAPAAKAPSTSSAAAAAAAAASATPTIAEAPGAVGLCQHCQALGSRRGESLVTRCEVRRHDHAGDLWIVAGERVFRVTEYLLEHPGGQRSLLRRGGGVMDCSEDLAFHSQKGRQTWDRFQVATLVECESPEGATCTIL
jgi:hypothetical protein